MEKDLQEHYGYLFEKELLQEILNVGSYIEILEDVMLMDIGQQIKAMPLLLNGAIKVLREDKNGDELILYFIEQGDTCAMTITCCMGQKKSEVRAVAETDTKLIMVPVEKMGEWMGKYKSWQNYILQSYHDRMMEMLDAIDNIAFLRMDERLFKHLLDKAKVNHNDTLQTTHQEIANDMHTSRVVISRLLKALEKNNKIELYRNAIKILDL
ncbi:Crp/Fnr family transcriptional regulator [uncultured Lacinutrix sp.]|uniref:Crp/Fnr family transcriptional regulator n=1 Tax=uncultured Lacinutrix sp. TaxID=574032 RepID=UPI00260C2848|nr:Crp/Fnr family transcriptional regulator [uncultured Lacinutrix sp.]